MAEEDQSTQEEERDIRAEKQEGMKKPREGFTKEGKPRYVRTPEGNIFQWTEKLAKKPGFLECNADGVPFSMSGGLTEEQQKENADLIKAIEDMNTVLDSKIAEVEELTVKLEAQKKSFSEKEKILSDEYKKMKAQVDDLKKQLAAKGD